MVTAGQQRLSATLWISPARLAARPGFGHAPACQLKNLSLAIRCLIADELFLSEVEGFRSSAADRGSAKIAELLVSGI